jgi:transposase
MSLASDDDRNPVILGSISDMSLHSIVGIDVAKATFDVAVPLGKPGQFRTRAKLVNQPKGFAELKLWLSQHAPEAGVCMEATSIYHEALATYLYEQGVTVYVVNPLRIARFAESELLRAKTDRTDAKLIARFASAQENLRPWTPPTPSQKRLRALVMRLEDLQQMRVMEENRRDVTTSAAVLMSIERVLQGIEEQIAQIRRMIDEHIDSDPDMKGDRRLLESIPGIGPGVSTTLLACVGDLRRFDDPGKLTAFTGLNSFVRESGKWKGSRAIAKLGSALVRAKLYMSTLTAIKHNPAIRAFVKRLRERGKPYRIAMVAGMRKLLHIAWGVICSGRPFDPQIALA